MNELIERLKDNTTPYGLCSNEERATFESVGANNCRVYNFNGWGNSLNTPHKFSCQLAYQIKSDYQPEPEPNLGCATTGQLLDELRARCEVNGTMNYRTVEK